MGCGVSNDCALHLKEKHSFNLRLSAALAVEHDKNSGSRLSTRHSQNRTGSSEFLTASLEQDGRAMSEVSSFHTLSVASEPSELQPSIDVSTTTEVKVIIFGFQIAQLEHHHFNINQQKKNTGTRNTVTDSLFGFASAPSCSSSSLSLPKVNNLTKLRVYYLSFSLSATSSHTF